MIKNLGVRNFLLLLFLFSTILPFFVLGAPISMKMNESSLYIARVDGTIEVWNKSSGSLITSFSNEIEAWSFETDGTKFYIGSEDGMLHVFDLATRAWDKINLSLTSSVSVFSLKLDKDLQLLYTGLSDGNIIVINTPDLSIAKIIGKHERPVTALMLDEVYLYSVSFEGVIKVWDRPALVLLKNITIQASDEETGKPARNIQTAIIEDNKVYIAYYYGKIRIWDLITDSLLKEVNAHPNDVKAIVSDGEYIFSSSIRDGGGVKRWTLEGELVEPVLNVGDYDPVKLAVDNNYLYVGTLEGGILVYDKNNWNLTRKFGDFTWYARYEANKPKPYSKKRVNPMLPIFIAFAFFFVIAVIIEAYAHIRKKSGKLTWSVVRKFFASFVKVEDVLKILGITSIIILIVGIINPRLAFPYYISNLKIIYYFDALIKRGSFLPIWFLLLPTLAYWMTKKSKKGVRYLASALALAIAVVVYLLAPKLV